MSTTYHHGDLARALLDEASVVLEEPGIFTEPLDDAGQRRTLAAALVHDIEPAVLSVVSRAGHDVDQIRSLVRLVAETQHWAHTLEVDPDPFPGMTLP